MKPIIKVKRSTLGTNIVVRSPFSRTWLFNVTIAPKRETLEIETHPNYVMAKVSYAFTFLALVVFAIMEGVK
jgi:hypothetical protein